MPKRLPRPAKARNVQPMAIRRVGHGVSPPLTTRHQGTDARPDVRT